MGRWSYFRKSTVEGCHSISTKFLKDRNYLAGGFSSGRVSWSRNGQSSGNVSIIVSTGEWDSYIRFLYNLTDNSTGAKTEFDYKARLVSTPCNYGGRRWWFICPLSNNGRTCNRRIGVLYLAGKYFGCRHCYDLTYTSCQEHDKRLDMLRKNPGLMMSLLEKGSLCQQLLASKAALKNMKGI
jgi:hypothetical protein